MLAVHYPEHRRQGHGRAALVQVEKLAEAMGLTGVALNVFGSNSAAQALYRSLGYSVTSLSMHKPLSISRAALPPGRAGRRNRTRLGLMEWTSGDPSEVPVRSSP